MSTIMPTSEPANMIFIKGSVVDVQANEIPQQDVTFPDDVRLLPDRQYGVLEQPRPDGARFWLAAIADSSNDAIVGQDLDGRITSWNRAAETMFGYEASEILGRPITRIIPLDLIDEEVLILERVRRSEKVVYFETKRQHKDGGIIPVSLTISLIRDGDGGIIGVAKTARDLTEMQSIHRDLEQREALLRSILDTVPDALIVVDKQDLIQSFSVAAERLFGYTSEEMRGQEISRLLPSPNGEPRNSYLGAYSATGERYAIGFGQRKDSSTFPMELTIEEVNLPGTHLFTAFVHDLTEQARRERELRTANTELERLARHLSAARFVADQSNRAKSRFLASMSHELRTPLNAILGYAELLRMEGGLSAAQSGRVEQMLRAGQHLLQMITSVLDLSEIEAEHVELHAIELNVLALANDCLDLVRPAADAKHLALSITIAPNVPQHLVTDATRLRQVLLNLLGNAVKFTSQGKVELRLWRVTNGSGLRIEVTDTGPGIPVEKRRHLFRDFERLDIEATRTIEGAGLGLAISSRLATLLGGSLGHHDNPNGGSVFWLEVPLDAAAVSPTVMDPEPDAPAPTSAALHVLVVDDVAINRDIAGSFLRAAGQKVTCVDSGAEAVAAVANTDFNVVLMDVRMPEMDGLEATRRIRALGNERGRVPIVALTAQAFTEQVANCRKAGMDGHLPKPFDPDSLLAAVLNANAAGPTHDKDPEYVPDPAVAAAVVPMIGSELPIFTPLAFERTTSHLAPEAVASYLEAIIECGETLLRGLRGPDALLHARDDLAEAAHTIAGSAGMFGFERLTDVGRRFERAVQADAADITDIANGLSAALEATLQAMHERKAVLVDV